jgi:hypothetical protein
MGQFEEDTTIVEEHCHYKQRYSILCKERCALFSNTAVSLTVPQSILCLTSHYPIVERGLSIPEDIMDLLGYRFCTHGVASMTPAERKSRRKELIEVFSDPVKVHIFSQFEQLHIPFTTESLQHHTKEIIDVVIRQVDVSGEDWCAVNAEKQVMDIADKYIAKFIRNKRPRSPRYN